MNAPAADRTTTLRGANTRNDEGDVIVRQRNEYVSGGWTIVSVPTLPTGQRMPDWMVTIGPVGHTQTDIDDGSPVLSSTVFFR